MHSVLPDSAHMLPTTIDSRTSKRRTEDLVYQAVTVAAILLVLGTLWVF